jgi:hypothetical protein
MKPLLVRLLLIFVCLLPASSLLAQTHTQSISFNDGIGPGNAGTYSPSDHFSVDLYLTFNGYNALGFDLWFEATASAAPFLSLTGFTYGTTFQDPIQPFAGPIGFTYDQGTGFYTTPQPSDFGATQNLPYEKTMVPPGTYFIGQLTVSLAGLTPGVYILRTAATQAGTLYRISNVGSYFPGTSDPFRTEPIPNSDYTITVVPEPATVSLIGLGAIGLAAAFYRKGREANS